MKKNKEIEFKNVITEEQYDSLLHEFKLCNNVFKLTNYYFDTPQLDLKKLGIVLRLRQKNKDHYKLTLKKQTSEDESYEYHLFVRPDVARNLLSEGFKVSKYFENVNLDLLVTYQVSLENWRASTPYDLGTLFIDKCIYAGDVDYEIEYEVNDHDAGEVSFNHFLTSHNIKKAATLRKSERALSALKGK